MKNKKAFIALLSVFAISGGLGAIVSSGCSGCSDSAIRIDAPTELEADLGTYVIPEYDVVDNDGMILAGYNVYLKSVKDADGEELAESYGSAITVEEAGIYSFVYSAGTKKVSDVTVSIDFADRTAPTINCDDSTIPKFLIQGNAYKVPAYTLSGDFVREKCWAKVFYIDGANNETEVRVESGRFTVENASGSYEIRIHVEDAAGNANDYNYARKVDGPENIVENKVLYLDEQFGERQVSCYQSAYTGGYVSKDTEGAHYYGEDEPDGEYKENGAYKVSFNGETETRYNEGLVVMDVPAIIDINEYEELYMYVYNDSENDIIMGSQWWNDTKVEKGKWTKLTWNTRAWGNNKSANDTKQIGLVDITGMTIRFIFDYEHKVIPSGDFYLSAMYGTPKIESVLEADENVLLSATKYYINDTVELNAVPIEGRTIDYYVVDGEAIPGNSFIATKEKHVIEAVYAYGELTNENMTWATPSELKPEGDDAQIQYMGNSEYWVMSYDVYDVELVWKYFGVYVGGSNQLLGFELLNDTGKLCGYGGEWKWSRGVSIKPEICSLIRGATEANPVKAVYVRRDNEIRVFIISNDKTYFVGSVEFSAFGVTGNNFGYGARKPGDNSPDPATVVNFKAVSGETKTNLHFFGGDYDAELTVDGVKAEGKHYLGDKVTLTPAEAPEGKMFAYFKVNGNRILANTFRITSVENVVETVYTEPSEVTLDEGIVTIDGKSGTITVPQDTYVTFEYKGTVPSGKYFIGFKVDGEEFLGTEIKVTQATHSVKAMYADKIETGAEKLNNISDTNVLYSKDDDGIDRWKPASVEHVTDFMFTGSDKAVDENSVLKITAGGKENSFAFDNSLVDNLNAYSEIYFYAYTEAAGVQAGGWWCNDTYLVAGKWTKVTFGRNPVHDKNPGTIDGNGETKVWEAGINKFAFRIMNATKDDVIYVTAVYGLPYPDAVVTVEEGSRSTLTLSIPANGKRYKVNETVTLTAAQAPEGKVFAYFTANGEPFEGNTFVLTEKVEFGVVYNEFSTIALADGIKTADGQTGTIRVARNVPVYLKITDAGKYAVSFSVDGEAIAGNSFIPTEGKTYSVTATVADRVANGNSQVNSVSAAAMHGGEAKLEFTNNIVYNGADGAVKEDGVLKISEIGGGDVAVKSTKAVGEAELKSFKEVYFYIYTDADDVKAGTYWCNDTAAVKGQWTKVTVYQDMNKNSCVGEPYDADGVSGKLFADGSKGSNFVFRIMGGEGKTVYITSLYGVPYGDATVKIAEDSKDSLTVSAPANGNGYKEGETVTLTAAPAPAGKAFAYFTADGEPVEGNTYVLEAGEVTFGVVYSEISVITLSEGVTAEGAADGKVTVGRGATVTLVFNGAVPSGKYFAGFAVDSVPISDDTFAAENEAHTVTAVFEDKIQTGSDKLNEIGTVAEDGLSYHPTQTGWRPEEIKYVTDVTYNGPDGAIDESGSLKVTLNGGEQAFALNKTLVNTLDIYKEIYFYVYADKGADVSGIKIGGWWHRDVDVVAGQWTRVSFTREKNPQNISENSVWTENSIDKFAFSFKDAKAGTVVYLTAIYGVPYAEVSVTVADSVKDYVSFTGVCRERQTITLSHSGAPENKEFVYFTVNGERYDKDTYVLGTEAVEIGAYFTDAKANLQLGAGVATSDGKTAYALGETVTLEIDSATAPENKVFDHFEVDDKAIAGSVFVTKATSHKVVAIFIDDAEYMTWEKVKTFETVGSDAKAYELGENTHWVLSYGFYDFDVDSSDGSKYYIGAYVGDVGTEIQLIGYEFAWNNSKFDSYGGNWKHSATVNLEQKLINIFAQATEQSPAILSYVRSGDKVTAFVSDGENTYLINEISLSEFEVTNAKFGIAERDGYTSPSLVNIKFITGEGKTGLFNASLKANISYTKASAAKDGYLLGETVTLIADAAKPGEKFLRFTVNGDPIAGDTFTVKSTEKYEVVAEYSEISTLTLGDGVKTADGNTEYARGAKVKLSFDEKKLGGKVVDYYIIDEDDEQRIFNGEFTTTAATHSVKAVLATVDNLTWTEFAAENVTDYGGWVNFCKTGETKEDWIIEYKVTEDVATGCSLGVYLGSDHWAEIEIGSEKKLHGHVGGAEYWTKVTDLSEDIVTKLQSAGTTNVTLTWIRKGNTLTVVLDKTRYIGKFDFGDAHTGEQEFGTMFRGDGATEDMFGNIKFLVGESRVNAYKDYIIKNVVDGQTSETQINNIYNAEIISGSGSGTLEYVVDMPKGLSDGNVKENGVMKVSVTNGEFALNVKSVFTSNLDAYKEIYFWVYVSDADTANMQAGTYWCANTDLTTGWNKITITRDTNWAWNGGVVHNGVPTGVGEQKVYEVGAQVFVYRLMNCSDKTLYITSLYGVPKDVEPIVQNGATNYSLVSGNDELTAIVNESFFPDAE